MVSRTKSLAVETGGNFVVVLAYSVFFCFQTLGVQRTLIIKLYIYIYSSYFFLSSEDCWQRCTHTQCLTFTVLHLDVSLILFRWKHCSDYWWQPTEHSRAVCRKNNVHLTDHCLIIACPRIFGRLRSSQHVLFQTVFLLPSHAQLYYPACTHSQAKTVQKIMVRLVTGGLILTVVTGDLMLWSTRVWLKWPPARNSKVQSTCSWTTKLHIAYLSYAELDNRVFALANQDGLNFLITELTLHVVLCYCQRGLTQRRTENTGEITDYAAFHGKSCVIQTNHDRLQVLYSTHWTDFPESDV